MNENNGENGNYYRIEIKHPLNELLPYTVECYDIIQALNMDFNEGEAFKAIWRKAASRLGNKKGTSQLYDAQKVRFYGNGMVKKELYKNE